MNIQSTFELTRHFKQGAFGRVELDFQTRRAIKLFLAIDTSQASYQDRPWENEIRKIVFAEEVQAYELANSCPDLLFHVPKFFGKRSFTSIKSESGEDVSHLYLLDCCYEMELIEGRFEKIHNWPNHGAPIQEVERITSLFQKAGINHTIDADATTSTDLQRIEKVIDFAIRETYYEEENLRI